MSDENSSGIEHLHILFVKLKHFHRNVEACYTAPAVFALPLAVDHPS